MSKVSVIIPTYNRANLIGRAIQSVLDQTYRDFQLIVVDDASTDSTEGVVKAFNDNTIQYIRHMMNRGANSARNTGIENTNGEYIAFLDDDDEWLPEYLDQMISYLEAKDRTIGLVYCSFYRTDPDTKQVLGIRKQQRKQQKKGSSIGFPSRWIVRKEVFEKVGMFDEGMPAQQDTEFSMRLLTFYKAAYLNKPLIRYSVTRKSAPRDIRRSLRAVKLVLERHSDKMSTVELADWYIFLAKKYIKQGNLRSVMQNLLRAIRINPFRILTLLFLIGRALLYVRREYKRLQIIRLNRQKGVKF